MFEEFNLGQISNIDAAMKQFKAVDPKELYSSYDYLIKTLTQLRLYADSIAGNEIDKQLKRAKKLLRLYKHNQKIIDTFLTKSYNLPPIKKWEFNMGNTTRAVKDHGKTKQGISKKTKAPKNLLKGSKKLAKY